LVLLPLCLDLRGLLSPSSGTAAVLPVMDSAKGADFMKDIVKPFILENGFLRREFLNPSPAVKVSTPHSSVLESVVSSSTLDVKEDGVIGLPSPLSDCITPIFEKDNEFKVNGLSVTYLG
jgi:hypothetical protein